MRIVSADFYALHIPFRMDFAHSQAKRLASDSLVLKITAGELSGYGEAVQRDYVSGTTGEGTPLERASRVAARMLESLSGELTMENLHGWSAALDAPDSELPVLCAVETALLDLLCRREETDIYKLIGKEPVRETLTYGGTVPMLPLPVAQSLLELYRDYGIKNLRLKIGNDIGYNRNLVTLARAVMGDGFDLRVDANGAWDVSDALDNLKMLADFDIWTVEEPFGRDMEKLRQCLDDERCSRFTFVADESILSIADLEEIIRYHTFPMINIRLSKNGGLLRSLRLAEKAYANKIAAQLGCLVGETGILSAVGRVAASLMPEPVYVDGSYDEYLLSENITTSNLAFGRGGNAPVIRGKGLGFSIDTSALEKLSCERYACV